MRAGSLPGRMARAAARPARASARRLPPRARRAVAVLACAVAALAAGYLLWLRDSSLVRVEEVTVTGLTTDRAPEIRAALSGPARGMTTLHVDEQALQRAVAAYPAVEGVETRVDLPHGLAIEVRERRPVAKVRGPGGRPVPVAADGTLLPGFGPDRPLAELPGSTSQATGSLEDRVARSALAAAAAAPPALSRRIEAIEAGDGRLVAELDDGPAILLGDGSRLEAKWVAAVAALAEGGVEDAAYLDVALPERPAAGD